MSTDREATVPFLGRERKTNGAEERKQREGRRIRRSCRDFRLIALQFLMKRGIGPPPRIETPVPRRGWIVMERYSSLVSSSPFHEGEKFARREDEEIRNWVVGYIYILYIWERDTRNGILLRRMTVQLGNERENFKDRN